MVVTALVLEQRVLSSLPLLPFFFFFFTSSHFFFFFGLSVVWCWQVQVGTQHYCCYNDKTQDRTERSKRSGIVRCQSVPECVKGQPGV